jgi:hypothetical protein
MSTQQHSYTAFPALTITERQSSTLSRNNEPRILGNITDITRLSDDGLASRIGDLESILKNASYVVELSTGLEARHLDRCGDRCDDQGSHLQDNSSFEAFFNKCAHQIKFTIWKISKSHLHQSEELSKGLRQLHIQLLHLGEVRSAQAGAGSHLESLLALSVSRRDSTVKRIAYPSIAANPLVSHPALVPLVISFRTSGWA